MAARNGLRLGGWDRILYGSAILWAILLMGVHAGLLIASIDPASLPFVLTGALLGALTVDALTGLVHWACDTWGDERTPWLGPTLIFAFREHHQNPRKMLEHDWTSVNREPGVAAALALSLLSLSVSRRALEGHVFIYAFLCSFIAYGAAANQLHQWAHMDQPPRAVRWAQRRGLVLSPQRHARHHRAPNTSGYCISTGWMNGTLDLIGFWRVLERGISRLTGTVARASEHDRRFSSS